MQKVILIIVALFYFASTNAIQAQTANTTTEPTSTAASVKQDTLIVSSPNTVIIYQGAKVPVVYLQPTTQHLVPTASVTKPNSKREKIVLTTLAAGAIGMLAGGVIANNSASNGNLADILFSPITTLAGGVVGGLIGTGVGLGIGFALSK